MRRKKGADLRLDEGVALQTASRRWALASHLVEDGTLVLLDLPHR
jgi:hypothetical protein